MALRRFAAALTGAAALLAAGLGLAPASAADAPAGDAARGKYLVALMACSDCHTPGSFFGRPDMTRYLGGSDVGFHVPGLGYAWGANLTPDTEHGLGAWSADDIVKLLRTGTRPDGRVIFPVMPWMSYGGMSDEDAYAIAAYLKSLPPLAEADHLVQGDGETPAAAYQEIVFPPGVTPPNTQPVPPPGAPPGPPQP